MYYDGGTIPWATIGDINDRPILDTATHLTEAGAAVVGRLAPAGAVLVSMYGTIGRTGLAAVPMATNQAIAWGVPDDEKCSGRFLFLLVQALRERLDSLGRGATQRNINRAILREQPIPVPPLPEQRRIVDVIGALDAQIAALEGERSGVQTCRDQAARALLSREVEVGGGAGEEPWPEYSLDDLVLGGVVQLGRGKIISKTDLAASPGTYPVYSSAQKNNGVFGRFGEYMFDEELITWSIDGGGHLFYRPRHRFSVTNVGGFLRVLAPERVVTRYLFHVLSDLHAGEVFDWVQKAHPSVIRKIYRRIPLPSIGTQLSIANVLAGWEELIGALETECAALKAVRHVALSGLVSGEVEIPDSYDALLAEAV